MTPLITGAEPPDEATLTELAKLRGKLDKAERAMTVLSNRLYILHRASHGGAFADCPVPACKDARAALAAYREA